MRRLSLLAGALAAGLLAGACGGDPHDAGGRGPSTSIGVGPGVPNLSLTLGFGSYVDDAYLKSRSKHPCTAFAENSRTQRRLSSKLPDGSYFNLDVLTAAGDPDPLSVVVTRGWASGLRETAIWTRVQDTVFVTRTPQALPAGGGAPRPTTERIAAGPAVRNAFLDLAARASRVSC